MMLTHPAAQFPLCFLREAAHFDESGSEDPTSPDLLSQNMDPFLLPIWCAVGGRGPSDHRDKADLEEEKAQGQMYYELRSSERYYLAHKAKRSCKILRRRSFESTLSAMTAFTLMCENSGIARGIFGISLRGS